MQGASEVISPFEWWRRQEQQATPRRTKATQVEKPRVTAAERAKRILAQRWGSPYSKPGWP